MVAKKPAKKTTKKAAAEMAIVIVTHWEVNDEGDEVMTDVDSPYVGTFDEMQEIVTKLKEVQPETKTWLDKTFGTRIYKVAICQNAAMLLETYKDYTGEE